MNIARKKKFLIVLVHALSESTCILILPLWGRGEKAVILPQNNSGFYFYTLHNIHLEYCFLREILCRSLRDLFVSQLSPNCSSLGTSLNYSVYFINLKVRQLLLACSNPKACLLQVGNVCQRQTNMRTTPLLSVPTI